MHVYYVYIATNKRRTVLYTGITNCLIRRGREHGSGFGSAFTRKYRVKYLLYAEQTKYVWNAIEREKEIKGWTRARKIALIQSANPNLTLYQWNEQLIPVVL